MPSKSQVTAGATPLFGSNLERQLRDMVSLGYVHKHYAVGVSCRNDAVGTVAEDMWVQGGVQVLPSVAAVGSVVSSDVADDDGSTGAESVLIRGLDANYKEISETVVLNGTGAVSTANSYLRVNDMIVNSAGTGRTNAGNITITVGGNVQRQIPIGYGRCPGSHYTVPAGHTAYLDRLSCTQGQNHSAVLWVSYRDPATNVWLRVGHMSVFRSRDEIDFGLLEIPEKSDIRVQTLASGASGDVTARYSMILKED